MVTINRRVRGNGGENPSKRRELKSKAVRTYTAVIHREAPWYVASCPEVGVVSQGKNIDEAIANLKEATELHLEEFQTSSETP